MLRSTFFPLLTFVRFALAGQAVWQNTQCGKISVDRIDPIISPGVPSSHLHVLFGASAVSRSANYDTLIKSECNTCGIAEDNSLYWIPTIMFWRKDNTYSPLAETSSIPVYYKLNMQGNDIPANTFEAFPEGFQMVTGNPNLRTCDKTSDEAQRTLWYVCDGDRSVYYPNFPRGRKCKTLTVGINFPWCWNGEIDSADHQSHMAYPINYESNNEMKCPASHPKSLPVPFIEHDFDASIFQDMYDEAMDPEQPFTLSNGDATGCGVHADFQNGWDLQRLQFVIENYKLGQESPTSLGWLTSRDEACPEVPPSVPDNQGEPLQWMDELPGGLQASADVAPAQGGSTTPSQNSTMPISSTGSVSPISQTSVAQRFKFMDTMAVPKSQRKRDHLPNFLRRVRRAHF